MSSAKRGDTVKVHYTGSLDDGTVFDTSAERDPLEFTVGSGNVIPGFEEAVMGMSVGESKTEKVSSDQAYGPHRQELQMVVDRSKLPPNLELEEGLVLGLKEPNGDVARVTVSELTDTTVTLDGNHPLAGQDLTFEIELVEIKES